MSDRERRERKPTEDEQDERRPLDDEESAGELDSKLDVGIDGSFPASDPPSIVSPARAPRHESDD